MTQQFLTAIYLTTLAGLATTIGSIIALFYKEPTPRYMAFTMGFSAGVMILVSFVELLQQGIKSIGFTYGHIAFFSGMGIMYAIDVLFPHDYIMEKHNLHRHDDAVKDRLKKASVFVAAGIAIHNFPEGMATFAGTMKSTDTGIAIAAAIAIHNIPEGIAVSVPVYASTGNARKAFLWSTLSGISEPIGALIAGFILLPFLNDTVTGFLLAAVGGLMVFIAFDELLPISHSYGKEHLSIIGVITGMMVMALSLAMIY
ncbi:MAG: hypothetical protein A2073_06775 [Deltaproteobacteria bacterium GWC2_42_11]|nr:MAG: hypothetical protein A2073_06775 [Deltaproteobacteria bacterium GWC2_42_11]HBO83961.1 zinc transporter ZupT [Deltaproteobacteria bacterium]